MKLSAQKYGYKLKTLFYFYYFKQYFAIFQLFLFLVIILVLAKSSTSHLLGWSLIVAKSTNRIIKYKIFWYLKTLNTFLKGILLAWSGKLFEINWILISNVVENLEWMIS